MARGTIALGGTAHAQQGMGLRDLTPEEKTVIMDAVAPSLRNPGSAKYHWASFQAVVTAGSVNYCATVDAQSPYAAYNGRQAYIVESYATALGNSPDVTELGELHIHILVRYQKRYQPYSFEIFPRSLVGPS
jgi:hypothetical protein